MCHHVRKKLMMMRRCCSHLQRRSGPSCRRMLSEERVDRAARLEEAVNRAKEHAESISYRRIQRMLAIAQDKEHASPLKQAWWQLENRRRRIPSLPGWVTSLLASFMVHHSGLTNDGRFEEGAARALEALHEAVGDCDEEALSRFCDAPLAAKLVAAAKEAKEAGYRVEHGVKVMDKPRISWWRLVIGEERNRAIWEDRDGRSVAVDDWCAIDYRSSMGVLMVFPRTQFDEVVRGLEAGSIKALSDTIYNTLNDGSVSVQAAVDFPNVREALVAYTDDGSEADHYWAGSTIHHVNVPRQLIFESTAYRNGYGVDEPEWKIVDVDNILDGGAPYWQQSVPRATNNNTSPDK